jgi:hypothetical protein
MTLAISSQLDSLRGCADKARACVEWARTVQVTIRTRLWAGGHVGSGLTTDTDLVLPKRFPIRQLNAREVASSGGRFMQGDVVVEGISPAYTSHGGGGYTSDQLDPKLARPTPMPDTRFFYLLDGDETGTFVLVSLDSSSSVVAWSMVLRNTRTTP